MKILGASLLLISSACASQPEPPRRPEPRPEPARTTPAPAALEATLGVSDRGIYADLEHRLQLAAPAAGSAHRFLLDERRELLVLYVDGWPRKVYPTGGPASLEVAGVRLALRSGDAAELEPLARSAELVRLGEGDPPPGDRDRDGIPDPLDILIGAHKAALNGDAYDDRYFALSFPNGDPPRESGACVDVIVRAVRNAGLDLQSEVFADIRGAASVYGKTRPDPNIDHRRVKTVLVYFRRHWQTRSPALDDPNDPLRVGDVVLFDTFPNRPGPDHIGIVSELRGESGRPLVINNWTFGTTTQPMDLLGSVPVTHRFRFPSRVSSPGR